MNWTLVGSLSPFCRTNRYGGSGSVSERINARQL